MTNWAQTRVAFCGEPHGSRPCPGHLVRVTVYPETRRIVVALDGIELVMDTDVFATLRAMVAAT